MYKNETEGEGESDGEGESSDTIDYLLEETDIPYDEEDHVSEGEPGSSVDADSSGLLNNMVGADEPPA